MNLFCEGQKVITDGYRDGYFRTFMGIPEMNKAAKDMIDEWLQGEEYEKVLLFFIEKCGYDAEYSGFLLREFIKN